MVLINLSYIVWQMKEKTFFWCQWITVVYMCSKLKNWMCLILFPPVHYNTLSLSMDTVTCLQFIVRVLHYIWLHLHEYWYCIRNGTHVQSSCKESWNHGLNKCHIFWSKIFTVVAECKDWLGGHQTGCDEASVQLWYMYLLAGTRPSILLDLRMDFVRLFSYKCI